MSTSSTCEHDVATARGSPTWEMRSSVNTTVDALSTRPASVPKASSASVTHRLPPTGLFRRAADEEDDIAAVLQIVERGIEVAVALVESVGERATQ